MSSPLKPKAQLSSCDQVQDQLSAYRTGEGSPLARQRVELHLQHCANCQALFELQEELAQAARQGPAPLSPQHKQNILQNIHQEIDLNKEPDHTIRSFWHKLLRPWPSAALATSMGVLIGFILLRALPYPQVQGWIKSGPGIEAYAYGPTQVHFQYGPKQQAQILLDKGALLMRFTRPVGSQPLEIISGNTRVIVRGTIFFVARQGDKTQVGVHRGKVELQSGRLRPLMVKKNQVISVSGGKFAKLERTNLFMQQLAQLYPHFIIEAPPRTRPDKSIKRPKISAAIDRAAITREIDAKQDSLRQCYEYALKRASSLSGKMKLELLIGEQGGVQKIHLQDDAEMTEDLRSCVTTRVKKWNFATPSIYNTSMTIPLRFRQGVKVIP